MLPPVIELRCPSLDTVIRMDVPNSEDWDSVHTLFTRQNVLRLSEDALRRSQGWEFLMEAALREGDCALELAWRLDARLDWINADQANDIDGTRRKWAVLWGLAARQVRLGLSDS
jgi:hypothetical protein